MNIPLFNAGDLRTPMMHQRPLRVRGGAENAFTISWADKRTLLCAVRSSGLESITTGREFRFAGKTQATSTHLINCRVQDYEILPDSRLVQDNHFVYEIVSVIPEQAIRNVLRITAIRSFYAIDSEATAVMPYEHTTDEIDFTVNQTISFSFPAGYNFYHDQESIVCTTLDANVLTQPTLSVGIAGTPGKYLSSKVVTQLTAQDRIQRYTTLGGNSGETTCLITIVGGTISGGSNYRGRIIVSGDLVAA